MHWLLTLVLSLANGSPSVDRNISAETRRNGDSVQMEVFYPNRIKDPIGERCDVGYPVRRMVPRPLSLIDSIKVSVREYLNGPTESERQDGFMSAVPGREEILTHKEYLKEGFGWTEGDTAVTLKEVSMTGDTVFVQLSASSQAYGGGSCRIDEILGPLKQTVRSIVNAARVFVFVKGHDDDGFQP